MPRVASPQIFDSFDQTAGRTIFGYVTFALPAASEIAAQADPLPHPESAPLVEPVRGAGDADSGDKGTAEGAGEFTVAVGASRANGTFAFSPRRKGAFYLVEPEILARMPQRDDLLTPGSFKIVSTSDEIANGRMVFVLTTARSTLPHAPDDLPNVSEAELWDDPEPAPERDESLSHHHR